MSVAAIRLTLIFLVCGAALSAAEDAERMRIADVIDQLGSEDYYLREEAGRELLAIGAPASAALRQAAAAHAELEVRYRARELLAVIQKYLFVEVAKLEGHTKFPAEAHRGWVTRSAVSPDGKRLFTIAGDCLREWNLETRTPSRGLGQFEGLYFALGVAPSGDKAISVVANDGTLAVWDLNDGQELVRLKGHKGLVWGAVITPDGKQAITGAWDKSIRVWDLAKGQEVRQFEGVQDHVRCLALSPDGTRLAAGHFADANQPGTLRIWDVASGKELAAMPGHTLEITSVVFSRDGSRVLTASFDGSVRLWDAVAGKLIREFKGHTGRLEAAAFSTDEQFVFSVANEAERTLRIWETESGANIYTSPPQPDGLLSVTPLPDNEQVITTGKDGSIKIWRWSK